MTEWITWGVLLILQNAAHTATSRARNSKGARGLWYNGIASIFSNGVWFASQFFIVNMLINVKDKPVAFATTLAFYVVLTAFGSVASHWTMMRFEKKRGIEHG
jgi:hypothetical protein